VSRIERVARFIASGIILGWLAYTLASWFLAWNPADASAYLGAAQRLREGGDLYVSMSPEAHEVYRYAPWFAFAWVPLTYLPDDLVRHAWSLAMLVCSALAVAPLLARPTRASVLLAALLGATLAETAMFGNVHPVVVAMLSLSIRRPSGPIWVGIAASLKLVPILFAVIWLQRGEWRKGFVAIAVAGMLFVPMLAFDLSAYVTDPGTGLVSLYAVSPALGATVAAAGAIVTAWLALHRSPYVWVAVAVLMFVGPPRVSTAYLAFLVPGVLLTLDSLRATPTTAQLRSLPSAHARPAGA
jgi:hypothetical protein